MFKFEPRDVLGLDIGSSQIKLIQLQKERSGYTVTAAAITEIPDSADDEKANSNTTDAIDRCLSSSGAQTRYAVCGVSGPEVAVRGFTFPPLPAAEVAGAVALEARQVCPFNIDESAVDYQLVPEDEQNIRGVMVAGTNKVIEQKMDLTKDASLKCVLMDVEGLALLNCLESFSSDENDNRSGRQTAAVLNVGNTRTTLAIRGENGLPFIRDISYAGNHIAEHIANEHNIDIEHVHKILCGSESEPEAELVLGKALADSLRRLVIDVNETLRYYAAQERSASVDRIFICGGFALVKGFVELLNDQLTAKAILWNPLENITCTAGYDSKETIKQKGPAMALAAGLAMRSI
jgi:type IV pilus assembly protein PilM